MITTYESPQKGYLKAIVDLESLGFSFQDTNTDCWVWHNKIHKHFDIPRSCRLLFGTEILFSFSLKSIRDDGSFTQRSIWIARQDTCKEYPDFEVYGDFIIPLENKNFLENELFTI